MTTRSAVIGRQGMRSLIATHIDPGTTDRDLLRQFTDTENEAAFETLVRRHGAMVVAVARRVLNDAQDAEDVCQAAFILLAQKARTQRWQPSIANWLHQTAHFLALKARRSAARRSRREEKAGQRSPANPLAEMTAQELLGVLDKELLALPELLRAPLVLCYLEGATRDEAARRLGCPVATLKKRLERGRHQLHKALVRRGLDFSAALLGTISLGQAATALPISFLSKTTDAALTIAAGQPTSGLISSCVSQLIEGGIGMTTWSKTKATLCILLVGGLLAGVGGLASMAGDKKQPGTPPKEGTNPPEKSAELPVQPAADGSLKVVVLDLQGKPLPDANVHASVWTTEKGFKAKRDIATDSAGVATVKLPKTFNILRIWVAKKSYATLFANWEQAELSSGRRVPAEYTIQLESATTAGSRVVDEKGKPIAGANVLVDLENDPKPVKSDGRVRYNRWLAEGSDTAITDAEGRWQIDNVPNHPEIELRISISHPAYLTNDGRTPTANKPPLTTKMLRDGKATVALKAGVIVRGVVTGPDGKPIKDAIVIHGDDPYSSRMTSKFSTDADGRYRLPALAAGKTSLTVIAPGKAPQHRTVDLKADLASQDFRMEAGKPVRLRICDDSGMPVPKAFVTLLEWKGSKSIYSGHNPNHPKSPDTGIPAIANAQGVWDWPAAPDEPVKISVSAKGFATLEMEVTAGMDRTVTLKAEHRVIGNVTDSVTGKPIPAFTIIPIDVFGRDHIVAERFNAVAGKNGRLDFLATRADIPLRVRIEASGYRTQDGREFRIGDAAGRKQDFRLVPSKPLSGIVVGLDGKPVANAEVLLATPTEQVRLVEGSNHRTFTNSEGRFEFPDPGESWAVVARTASGIVVADFPADRSSAGSLKLRPSGSIGGTFSDGGKPIAGASIWARPIRLNSPDRPTLDASTQTVTDAQGRFEFLRVPPGPVSIQVQIGPWKEEIFRSGPAVPLDLKPGEKMKLNLGNVGATISGKVKLTGKVPADLDCNYSLNYLVRREPGITPPPEVAAAGFNARKGWSDAWKSSLEGLAYLSTLRNWFVKLAPDGSFRISGVPAGEYDLAIAVYAKPSGCLVDPLARKVTRVKVTEADVASGTLNVPVIEAAVEPVPAVGDTPELSFTRTNGKATTLADFRKKYTVVHFWASWCGPCKKQFPALKKLHERYAGDGLTAISLSLDEDPTAWQAMLKRQGLPGTQGRLAAKGSHAVSSVPAYWLLDPSGKIVAKALDPEELIKAIEAAMKRDPGEK